MKKIFKSGPIEFAYDDTHIETTMARLAKRFGVHVLIAPVRLSTGWPEVQIVGELQDVAYAIRTSWESGDDEQDAEVLAYALADGEWID